MDGERFFSLFCSGWLIQGRMTGGDTSKYEREIKRKELRKWRRKDRKNYWTGNYKREKGEREMKEGRNDEWWVLSSPVWKIKKWKVKREERKEKRKREERKEGRKESRKKKRIKERGKWRKEVEEKEKREGRKREDRKREEKWREKKKKAEKKGKKWKEKYR